MHPTFCTAEFVIGWNFFLNKTTFFKLRLFITNMYDVSNVKLKTGP